jgi:benzoyl-CoA reductase subunit C
MNPRVRPTIAGVELVPYVWYMKLPQKIVGRKTFDYYLAELRYFKQHIERCTSLQLTEEKLAEAIEVYNKHYELMKQLHDMRKQSPPLISGYEAWEVEFASLLMPKDEHNRLMKDFLEELPKRQEKPRDGIKLYLSASAMDPVGAQLYKIIEECGGQVVSEDISWGTSYHWKKINTDMDPFRAIAEYRLSIHCPCKTVDERLPNHRFEYIEKTMAGYDVKGVIIYNLAYCECRAAENPHIRDWFRNKYNLPVLFLEGDVTPQGLELMRNRVEAFIEMLGG